MIKIGSYIIQAVREILNLLRISLFVPRCFCCQEILISKDEKYLCHSCQIKIVPYTDPVCIICGKALISGGETCGECLIIRAPFRRHVSFARYEGVLKELISLYKFKELQPLKKILVDCLAECFRTSINESFDWIVPVPADSGRKREVKPILDISRSLSQKLGIGLLKNNLVKVKKTPPQVILSRARRLRNLDGAFHLKKPGMVKNRKVLLVDDVYTTGTTVKKCSQQLKKAGAEVVALTLARSL